MLVLHSLYYRCLPWLIGHCSNYIPPHVLGEIYLIHRRKKTIHLSTCHGQVTIVILSFPSIFKREPPTFFSSAPCPSAPGSAPGSSHAKHRAGRLGAVLKPWSLAYKNLRKNRLFNVFPLSFENFMCNYTLCDVTLIHYLV